MWPVLSGYGSYYGDEAFNKMQLESVIGKRQNKSSKLKAFKFAPVKDTDFYFVIIIIALIKAVRFFSFVSERN